VPPFPNIAHVTLTVRDLGRSVPWYQALFGADPFVDESPGPFRRVVWLVEGETVVGLHEFPDPADILDFNERRMGLDHLAFRVRDRAELEQWKSHIEDLGIAHGGMVEADYGLGLAFRDPDNIALEFFAATT
jgi:catechol-2,3-dioxygenase